MNYRIFLLSACFIISSIAISDPKSLCHSSCGTCPSHPRDKNNCGSCSSSFLKYLSMQPSGLKACKPDPRNTAQKNIEFIYTIENISRIGDKFLDSININSQNITTQKTLAQLNVYDQNNIAQLGALNVSNIDFNLKNIGRNHYAAYFRLYLYTNCSSVRNIASFKKKLNSLKDSETSTIQLQKGQYKLFEPSSSILHTSDSLILSFGFNYNTTCFDNQISEISVYLLKCDVGCATCQISASNCTSCSDYYKLNTSTSKCEYWTQFCHSSCQKCTVKNDSTKCTACSSTLSMLNYQQFVAGQSYGACSMTPTNNAQVLMLIDQNSVLGNSSLKNVTFNQITNNTSGLSLSSLLYSNNIIDFKSFNSNIIELGFASLTVHKRIIVRARVYTSCVNESKNLRITLNGEKNQTVYSESLLSGVESIIEAQVIDDSPTFKLTFQFGVQGQICFKILQDISVYYEKCQSYCGSNICPQTQPYYKHPVLKQCLSDCSTIGTYTDQLSNSCVIDCPDGKTLSGNFCVDFEFCSSSCLTCTAKNNPNSCASCPTSDKLNYIPFINNLTEGSCDLTTTNNAQYLMTINKDTKTSSNSTFGQILYARNVIEFMRWKSITLTIVDFPVHKKVIFRARVYTECTPNQNQTVVFTLYGTPSTVVISQLIQGTESILEGSTSHTDSSFSFKMEFGNWWESCRKMVQDISLYYQACQTWCGSNDCPIIEPYFKHKTEPRCVNACNPDWADPLTHSCISACPTGSAQYGYQCQQLQFCHSTCQDCTVNNDPTQCSTCISSFGIVYQSFTNGQVSGSCSVSDTNNAQLLLTVSKITALGTTLLKSITYNGITQSTSGKLLSSFLYSQSIIQFNSLTSNTVTFNFDDLPTHKKIIVRMRVYTVCLTNQNQTIQMTLSADTPSVITQQLTALKQSIIEGEVIHSASSISMKIQFGSSTQSCSKFVQDFSIYYEKCQPYCQSNDCPDTEVYYKDPSLPKCVASCPAGYIQDVLDCVSIKLCHSTCNACSEKNDQNSCTSCFSSLAALNYAPFTLNAASSKCLMIQNNNAQILLTVNKMTELGTSFLKSVNYNGSTQQITGVLLGSFLYSQNVIQFNSLTSEAVIFNFDGLPIHKLLIIRVRSYTKCTVSQNRTIKMTLSGDTPLTISQVLIPQKQDIFQVQITHSSSGFQLSLGFGSGQQNCLKVVQDLTIYFEKCNPVCQSNICPDVEPYFKDWNQSQCVSDCSPYFFSPNTNQCQQKCPYGWTQSGYQCTKLSFCHSTCATCAINNNLTQCTSCQSTISSLSYQSVLGGNNTGQCLMTANSNAQYLTSINKDSVINGSLLKQVIYNTTVVTNAIGTVLSSFLFTENVIDFSRFSSNTLIFKFINLPTHKKIIIRGQVYTECSSSQNQSIQFIEKQTNQSFLIQSLNQRNSTIIEAEITHQSVNFSLGISFGTQGQDCRKILQDLSLYYTKCEDYCLSNNCPSIEPYYKDSVQLKCVNNCTSVYVNNQTKKCVESCPEELVKNGVICISPLFCHSTCQNCSVKGNSTQCSSCSSGVLKYQSFQSGKTVGSCKIATTTSSNNYEFLLTVDKNTIIGDSYLKIVEYNGQKYSTTGKVLSLFLYSGDVIDWSSSNNSEVKFYFNGLPSHTRIALRVRAYAQCQCILVIGFPSTSYVSLFTTISPFVEKIVETQIFDNATSFNMTINYQTKSDCHKLVQDFSIYVKKWIPITCQNLSTSEPVTDYYVNFSITFAVNYDSFCSQKLSSFLDTMIGYAQLPDNYTSEQKLQFLRVTSISSGSAKVVGQLYALDSTSLALTYQNLQNGFTVSKDFDSMGILSASFAQINTATVDPSPSPSPTSSFPIAIIIGAAAGGVLLIIIGVMIYICWRRRKQAAIKQDQLKKIQAKASQQSSQVNQNQNETNIVKLKKSQSVSSSGSRTTISMNDLIGSSNYFARNFEIDEGLNHL